MGMIPGDSSNIIVDAVLTDIGRQFLARNDGSFSIVKFAPGDDEVDYTIIQKFGRTVGQEKIEKNTPVFEALTNQLYSQKHRLVSISNPYLIKLPKLQLSGEGVGATGVSIGNTTSKKKTITITQEQTDGTDVDIELRDQSFIVQLDNRFLQILSTSGPDNIDRDQKATYILTRDPNSTSSGGSKLTMIIATKAILESQFQIYGSRSDKQKINTFVRVSGTQSGQALDFEVQITKTL